MKTSKLLKKAEELAVSNRYIEQARRRAGLL